MEQICYKTNPIKDAIARLDFLSPILPLKLEIPGEIAATVKETYPIPETRDIIANEFIVNGPGKLEQIKDKSVEWIFFNKERTRKVTLTQTLFTLLHNDYESYRKFSADFFKILDSLYSQYPDLQISRFGVRFVNRIEFDKGDPFSWSQYLNKKLLSIFEIPGKKEEISRAFHNLEMNYGDFLLRFQYGMHNPDYPAVIKKRVFIIDIDAYTNGIMNKKDIVEYFPKLQNKIQEFFEFSITNKYRNYLGHE